MLKNKVRRYWRKDLHTDLKEKTAVTKDFDDAIADISSVLSLSKAEVSSKLIAKGSLESKYQVWNLITGPVNPFALSAKKTPLE
ncbi:hypothetical protein C4577_03510 [Candidatus Parcubacteria bacterium]|nr:MAG: hypothetical protein C4577_03510 [Candidatus Parcubacteria bacterium]